MEVLLVVFGIVLKILNFLTAPIYTFIYNGKKQLLLPIDDELLYISATDLAEKIRSHKLSSEGICRTYINRIKQVNPILNAVVEERFNDAIQDAKNADIYLKNVKPSDVELLEKTKPLYGVPITIKESCSLKGMSLCVGTKGRVGIKAENDSVIVSRLKQAGAIPLCVTTVPELCLSWETNNLVTGTTNNAYDSTCTSGGSSGGEAALLGAGASVIGMGSDIAGSIRLPAMYNGVFGHKPTARIASIKGHYPYCNAPEYPDLLVIGPLSRYAKDLRLVLNVMVEPELRKELCLNDKVDLSKINVYFMEDVGYAIHLPSVQKEIKNCVRNAAVHLEEKCRSKIKHTKFADFKRSNEIFGSRLASIKDIPNVLKGENSNLFTEILKSFTGRSKISLHLLAFYVIQEVFQKFIGNYKMENEVLKKQFIETLGKNGVFIYPTFTNSAHKHNQIYFNTISIMYLLVANCFGLPSTHVPCGFDRNGMPIGIQVMAAPKQDRLCLAVAEELEKAFGGWKPPVFSK